MSTNHRSRIVFFGIAAVLARPSAPLPSTPGPDASLAEEEVLALAPVAAPEWPRPVAMRCRPPDLAAQRALLSGDIGSMQEDRLPPSWLPRPPGTTRAAMARSRPVGQPPPRFSLPSPRPHGTRRAAMARSRPAGRRSGTPASSTIGEAARLAQFCAVKLALRRSLGADEPVSSSTVESETDRRPVVSHPDRAAALVVRSGFAVVLQAPRRTRHASPRGRARGRGWRPYRRGRDDPPGARGPRSPRVMEVVAVAGGAGQRIVRARGNGEIARVGVSGRRDRMEPPVSCAETHWSATPDWLQAGRRLLRASTLRRNRLSGILISSC